MPDGRTRIEAVLFDFGGTLDNDGLDWFHRLYQALGSHYPELTAEDFGRRLHAAAVAMDALEDTCRLTLDSTVQRLCETFRAHVGGSASWDVAAVQQTFLAEIELSLERNKALLESLSREYRLGVISNNWGNIAGWCAQYGLSGYFETMIDSAVVGVAKPAREIFDAALTAMGLEAGACVYVGDSYDADMVGARQAGMRTVWVVGSNGKACADPAMVDARVERLGELPAVLRAMAAGG